ncbi:MAG: HD domain-containing protein [Lachnospiraceae bacterium]|nr:HD domain-containing protein [Lachnospiraceae bacterium]
MTRIDKIINNSEYKDYMRKIEEAEINRRFCLHGLNHALDVARICHIINLEEGLSYDKDMIYAMALLHDIGRCLEYEKGTPHHEAGVIIAEDILAQADFSTEEIKLICEAIASHKSLSEEKKDLKYMLFKADKLSRNCFACEVYDECYWKEELKNKGITY